MNKPECPCMFAEMTEAECLAFLSSGEQEEPEQYELKEVQKE